jgi:hypothetical protein
MEIAKAKALKWYYLSANSHRSVNRFIAIRLRHGRLLKESESATPLAENRHMRPVCHETANLPAVEISAVFRQIRPLGLASCNPFASAEHLIPRLDIQGIHWGRRALLSFSAGSVLLVCFRAVRLRSEEIKASWKVKSDYPSDRQKRVLILEKIS